MSVTEGSGLPRRQKLPTFYVIARSYKSNRSYNKRMSLILGKTYVAYYRVSKESQGASGLGIGAQREAILKYVGSDGVLAEFTEVESGRQHKNRPQLMAALAECKRRRAVLVIAKLDRLGRNVAFISALMESKVEFVCCDNPHATPFLLHVLAAFAEQERKQISQRTRDALAEAKRRGVKLGNPRLELARMTARNVHHASRPAPEVLNLMAERRRAGGTYHAIATELNRLGIRPARGKQWYASGVRNQLLVLNASATRVEYTS